MRCLQSHQITPETVPLWRSFLGGAEGGARCERHQFVGTGRFSSSNQGRKTLPLMMSRLGVSRCLS